MACPKCGGPASALSVVHTVVKVTVNHCPACHKPFRQYELTQDLSKEQYQVHWGAMHDAQLADPKETRERALKFLERQIESMSCGKLRIKKSLRTRMADFQDREYLKQSLGEDYTP